MKKKFSVIQNSSYNKELCIRKGSIIVTIRKIFLTYLIVFNYVRCVSPDIRVKGGSHPGSRISDVTKAAKDFTMKKYLHIKIESSNLCPEK